MDPLLARKPSRTNPDHLSLPKTTDPLSFIIDLSPKYKHWAFGFLTRYAAEEWENSPSKIDC
jgi:hypothetical protein